ncbi:D-TA family PLP-dependent enzyme [Pseudochryseolinea flava]|uniref:D-TA family PLP-dependent enzyme n=1 Tax=Pseudochryseolinea flava TaxID=2059302 RepID=A0A364XWI2_9BACT|nr:D-TA family PLP-dependent enzyme [Pseudochryseolinea flava]RAV98079.1 D-TA family PLP-dependent enzyme [Pseudochryseolinea flava]
MQEWYALRDVDQVDSPALILYKDRIVENIARLIRSIDDVARLRPHIKTHKSAEVSAMMLQAGIQKFKCATIAEAEMLASAGAKDVLLAYQPVGPKAERLAVLQEKFQSTTFSCLIDNVQSASAINSTFQKHNRTINVYIDLNVGMNRTGIVPAVAFDLYTACSSLKHIAIIGLHAYDGHLRDTDMTIRTRQCDDAFAPVVDLQEKVDKQFNKKLVIVAGGTPTYSIHSKRKSVECSPGTFIYWDKGYEQILQEQHYLHAALVLTRIISIPSPGVICTDLGHKAIASENPLANRVYFLNAPDLLPTGHSEEHMVFTTSNPEQYRVGDALYGVPHHVCPTVALHEEATVVESNHVIDRWINISRKRKISV